MILASLATPELPAITPVFTPTALLVTSAMVGCIGAVVLFLSRQQGQELADGQGLPSTDENGFDGLVETRAETVEVVPSPSSQYPLADSRPAAIQASPKPVPCEILLRAEQEHPAARDLQEDAFPAMRGEHQNRRVETATGSSATAIATAVAEQDDSERGVPSRPFAGPSRTAVLGPSALIADAERLLPAAAPGQLLHPTGQPTADATSSATSPATLRGGSGFQPAARFSRSQQAFLRIPIVITGANEAGVEFREETSTVILLPQGAVIHMQHRVATGDRLKVLSQPRQHEAQCTVFGALSGPDGKMLVEIEFDQHQRTFWPVSFPAWAGKATANTPGNPARATSPARAPVMNGSGS